MYVVQYSIILKTFLVVENRLFFNIVFKNYICWKHINIGKKKPATKETSTYHHTDSLEKKEVIKSL